MHSPADSPLGRGTDYPDRYAPDLLYPIARAQGRQTLGLGTAVPFIGHDRWHAYELGWLDARGKPQVATATFVVPADSPNLIESKSFKLYLNSFNAHRLDSPQALQQLLQADLSRAAGAPVALQFGLPPVQPQADADTLDLDRLDIDIDHYGPPRPEQLIIDGVDGGVQRFSTALLKSNCPVTGQPDWADLSIVCAGPRIAPASLLRYLCGFRDHGDFHEQCVERIWCDIAQRCQPRGLSVEARYTRRGGLDINPWRASPGMSAPPAMRGPRQ